VSVLKVCPQSAIHRCYLHLTAKIKIEFHQNSKFSIEKLNTLYASIKRRKIDWYMHAWYF